MNNPPASLPDRIPLLTELSGITAFSTTRGPEADVADPYSGFSVCHYTGDDAGHYMACREQLARTLGLPANHLIIPRQVHGSACAVITGLPASATAPVADALVTNQPGVALCINTADCVPVLLADPEARIIAAAHCGWRGTVAPLLDNTVEAMTRLGADPSRIRAAMGPSICTSCFEVGPEVAARFNDAFPTMHNSSSDCELHIVHHEFGEKPHIDLAAAITARLTGFGLQATAITPPLACSHCNPGRFFSARHSGISSGRTLTLITLPA